MRWLRMLYLVLSCVLWLLSNAPSADARSAVPAPRATGLPYWTYKGFTVAATSPHDLFQSGSTLRAMVRLGVNTVTFVVTWYAPSVSSPDIVATGGTATDAALVWAIRDLTLAPGQSYRVEITRRFGAADPPGRWHAYLTIQAIDGSWHGAGKAIQFTLARAPARLVATGSGRIVVVGPLVLSRRVVRRGETVTARATSQNQRSAGITLARTVIAARPPGGTTIGGPFADFGNTTTIMLAPGQRYTVQQTRVFSAADPLGQWYSYLTYQDGNRVWFDQPSRVILVWPLKGSLCFAHARLLQAVPHSGCRQRRRCNRPRAHRQG